MGPESIQGIQLPTTQAEPTTVPAPSRGASIGELGQFQGALDRARATLSSAPEAIQPAVEAVMHTLKSLNTKGADLSAAAEAASASDGEMSPGEMVMLTVRAHEFLFTSQLTANIANRTSDGLQQLFRQQG